MGIYNRHSAAVLVACLFFASSADAATRKNVPMPSAASVATGPGTPSRSGSSLSIPGTPQQEYIPRTPNGTAGVPVKVLPRVDYSIPRTIKAAGSIVRATPAAILGSVALQGMLDAIGGLIDDAGKPVKPGLETSPNLTSYWCYQTQAYYCVVGATTVGSTRYVSPDAAVAAQFPPYSGDWTDGKMIVVSSTGNTVTARATMNNKNNPAQILNLGPWTLTRFGDCPPGYTYNQSTYTCTKESGLVPLSDSDYQSMFDWANAQNADWLKGLLEDTCANSPSPGRCFDEMKDQTSLSGPTSVTGPSTSTTTTTKNADGTTATTTTTTKTTYNIKYGDNHYNYSSTTNKTTVNPDGTTSTETSTDGSLPSDQEEPPEEEQYSFDDADFPEVTPFYEQKYPDGMSGVWNEVSAKLDNSAFIRFLNGFIPSFSGSCPAFGLGFNIAAWASYGNVQFSSICYVLDFVKIILLVTALFTFRKVTFGG